MKGSFEEALERLGEITRALDEGDVGLDEALSLYKEGRKLVRECRRFLEGAEAKLEEIERDDEV